MTTTSVATRAFASATLIAAAFIAVGCVSAAPATSGVPPAPVAPAASTATGSVPEPAISSDPVVPDTPWRRALNAVDENGQYSLDAALTLFATAFGPLPGVDVEQDLSGIGDRTIAISKLMAHRSELTAEQLAAVDRYLAMPAEAQLISVPPIADARNRIVLAQMDDASRSALADAALDVRAQIAARLGRDFAGDISIGFLPTSGPPTKYGGTALADAWSDWPGGVFGDCSIRIYKEVQAGEPVEWLNTLTHELFHCFQFDGYRTLAAQAAAPPWVMEGQTEWVAATLTRGADVVYDSASWAEYLAIAKPLTTRNVDAIGFYAHLAETGTDPWSVLPDMWAAGSDNIAIFEQANANTNAFLDSWASSVMREPSRGAAWDTTGPGIEGTDASFAPPWFALNNATSVDLSSAFFDNSIRMLQVNTDLLHVSIDGNARLNDRALDTTELTDAWFCVEGRDCEPRCPEDVASMPRLQGTVRDIVAVASSGGVDGTIGRATGRDLRDEPCETPPPTPPSPKPTEDEFCKRYRAMLEWAAQYTDTDFELSQPWAAEIARRSQDMRPYAPEHLIDDVDLYIRVYGTYASAPEPVNVPIVGPDAAGIATAFLAMNAYCGITA